MAGLNFMDLSVDIKTLIVQHVIRPTDLKNLCLVCKQLHEISVRQLYHEVTLDVGSANDNKLGAFLNPRNIGLKHVRKLDLYLADVLDKCNQLQQAHFAIRMILELLPENILEKFSWHPWSPFSGENLILLYKKQKKMKWLEGIALDKEVLQQLEKIPDFDKVFENVKKLGLYPDSREVLDFCHLLVKKSPKVEKITLHASFEESDSPIPNRELNDSSTGPGLITSTMFSHMHPFAKCTPMALKEITLQKINLRYATESYCRLIDFRTVKSIRVFACPGADALFAELSKSTKLPEKLETLECKHDDNIENDGLGALDGFMCLVSGIKTLTIDLTLAKSLPAAAGIIRHGKTLQQLNVHASRIPDDCDEELVYDYSSFSQICKDCPLLEQISVAFPQTSILRNKSDSFTNFENCLGELPNLVTLNITTWPNNQPSSTKMPRKVYEHLLQGMAQLGFEKSVLHATLHNRTSKLAIIAFGSSDKVYDREDSQNQIIFVKGRQVDPLGNEKSTAIQIGWCLRKFVDAGPKNSSPTPRPHRPRHIVGTSSMSQQYPPPPSDDTHYAPIYPATPNTQLFPKIENLSHVLQQQAQQAHQASHALSDHQHNHASPHVGDSQSKPNRLRKACDSCSIRKVKCDESGPPCRACAALDIPCTFDRPSRRRGPPNRHAEAIKKKRRVGDGEPGSGPSTPASPTNAAHALAQLSSHPPHLSAESICSLPTMNALIDDFFTYIHPLCPFPHEPSFREAWERREDYSNPAFLALLASMIAVLVSSFPRKPRLHLKSQTRDQYPSHLSLVDKCREVCAQARGPGYLDRPNLNVYDACTSYFLGLTGAYIFQWRQLRLYFGECLTILRSLGLHKAHEQGYTYLGGIPGAVGSHGPNFEGSRDLKLDNITEQIGRRVFWTLFVGAKTMQQLGASFGELAILPSTPSEPLPPLPLEIDDPYVYPQDIMSQPPGVVSLITGFNTNVRIYNSYSTLSTAEMVFGVDELFDWDRQQKILEQSLQRCKQVLDGIPDVLQVQPKDSQHGKFGQRTQPYYPPMPEYVNVRDPTNVFNGMESQEARRHQQYEIQKANIYASHLSIRSHLVEKYFALLDKHSHARTQAALQGSPSMLTSGLDPQITDSSGIDGELLEKVMMEEREQVVKDVLVVLGSIDMVNMEPNGDSFTQKIRQIARTLLDVPKERRGSLALQQHQDYLYKFLDVLSKLERVSPEGSDPNTNGGELADEESELRHWADLRDYQLKFQEQGGIYGFS
ncbi:uncharacterized protein BDR25DRAFT_330548 [Lindgomyces ingoldianus]|uniref:Uncharacterized protein n=1 Tax=Lindgomyces ingoldianus TaxID=673940 RepID=A0ACB6RHX5_9PLEO|nr:uncharacterized protein BDR25DRAFT_330548 [Lindgomyces ingoldianus]KAF2477935.1 hypothetical protein BDR25DRAFT_330548 [Lindgomyces ingoldianus]